MPTLLPLLSLGGVLTLTLVSLFAVPLGLSAIGALRAARARRTSLAARAAFDGLTLLAASIVRAGAAEVRDLKDPTKPGTWTPAAAARIFQRAVFDLGVTGAGYLRQLRALQGLTPAAAEALLERTVEAQVEALRQEQTSAAGTPFDPPFDPAHLAGIERLHDLVRDPAPPLPVLRSRTLPLGFPPANDTDPR